MPNFAAVTWPRLVNGEGTDIANDEVMAGAWR